MLYSEVILGRTEQGDEEQENASAQNSVKCKCLKGTHAAAFVFPSSGPGR